MLKFIRRLFCREREMRPINPEELTQSQWARMTRNEQLAWGRKLIAKQNADTHMWKLMLVEARRNGWEWPLIDEKEASWIAKHPNSWINV